MSVQDDLQKSVLDESVASHNYRMRAIAARSAGDEVSARLWEHVADEEDVHYNEFMNRLAVVRVEGQRLVYRRGSETMYMSPLTEDYELMRLEEEGWVLVGEGRRRRPSPLSRTDIPKSLQMEPMYEATFFPEESHRPFPKTTTEWEDLGYDIEAKLPDIGGRYSIRDAVAIATGKKEGNADEAKRWLVRKAGELGVC